MHFQIKVLVKHFIFWFLLQQLSQQNCYLDSFRRFATQHILETLVSVFYQITNPSKHKQNCRKHSQHRKVTPQHLMFYSLSQVSAGVFLINPNFICLNGSYNGNNNNRRIAFRRLCDCWDCCRSRSNQLISGSSRDQPVVLSDDSDHDQMQGLSAANNEREFGLESGNRRNLNHNGSNNGNIVISLIDSNRSNQSISGSTQNRMNRSNVITRLAVESKATTKKFIRMQFANRRGIAVTKMVVSVIDSYSQKRIAVPVRGRACPHLQPFDAKSFLSRPEQYQKCTQCNKRIRKEHLVKMEYFQLIFDHLEKFHPKVERIEIQRDGTWHKVLQQHR